ncbi:hypothetical protein AAG906_029059 [Vitis piasezkii]
MLELREIPSQVISGLSSLQLFSIMDSQEHIQGDIDLYYVPSIQTLLNSHMLQRCLKILQVFCPDINLLHLLFPYLEKLVVMHCWKLKDVTVNLEKEVVHSTFPRHQYLYHLSEVKIESCANLMKLTCLIYASNLKLLNILDCTSLEEVIQVGESGVSEIESDLGLFSRLVLEYMRMSLLFPSLRVMNVVRCPNLRKLPFDSNLKISKNLEEIKGEQESWAELEWEDQTIKHNLTPYFKPQDW